MELQQEQLGRITVLRLQSNDHVAVDAWKAAHLTIFQNTPPDEPFLILDDFSHPDVGYTPYLRAAIDELVAVIQNRSGRVAFLLKTMWGRQILKLMFASRRGVGFEYKVCQDRDEAMAWLQELEREGAV